MRQCQCLLRRCDSTSRYVRSPLHCGISAPSMSALGRLCCKSPKLPGDKILAIRRTNRRPPIYAASVTLPSSPARSSSGNEVPHIFTRKSRLQPGEFLVTSAKRLLQQYRHKADLRRRLPICPLLGQTGHDQAIDYQQRSILSGEVISSHIAERFPEACRLRLNWWLGYSGRW